MNKYLRNIWLLIVMACLMPFCGISQGENARTRYINAKALYHQGKYDLAMESFKQLAGNEANENISTYSGYFYALSAYEAGYKPLAKDMFLQIAKKHPDWPQINEVYLWMSRIGFETSGVFQGMMYAQKVRGSEDVRKRNKEQKEYFLTKADYPSLQNLYESYPDDAEVGGALAKALKKMPFEERDNQLLENLVKKFDLSKEVFYSSVHQDVFKEQYHVAVLLPLFFDRMAASGGYLKKTLAVDILEGIKMAVDHLDSGRVDIKVYDTKMDSATTAELLLKPEMTTYDAIIGPLYPQPSKMVSSFAYEYQINMINPATSNPLILEKNPFAFLYRADARELGEVAADYACKHFTNKTAAIYYGTRMSDSLTAVAYKQRLEKDSFNIAIVQRIGRENKRAIFDILTKAKSIPDTVAIAKMSKEEIRKTRLFPMMDSLFIPPDSIGHIFLASDKQTLAAEVMAAVVARSDTIRIVGIGDWFSQANASLDLIERLDAWIAITPDEDQNLPENKQLIEEYVRKYHSKPGKYFFYGYYTMRYLSKALNEHGKYFQNSLYPPDEPPSSPEYSHSFSNDKIMLVHISHGSIVPIGQPPAENQTRK